MVKGRADGTGRVLLEMLDGMAMAAKLDIKFAGSSYTWNNKLDMKAHAHLLRETVPLALGISDFGEVMKNKYPRKTLECDLTGGSPACSTKGEGWSNSADAKSWVARALDAQQQLLDAEGKKGLEAAWTPRFLKALRSQAMDGLKSRSFFLNSTKPLTLGSPMVAMHLRRGDVRSNPSWYTPNKYYEDLVDRIWKVYPKAQIHIWSEGPQENFASLGHKGVHVHLNDHPMDAMASLASAQILVGAKGSFSHYAKVLNKNCVIVSKAETDNMLGSNPNWVDGDDDQSSQFAKTLSACVDRL